MRPFENDGYPCYTNFNFVKPEPVTSLPFYRTSKSSLFAAQAGILEKEEISLHILPGLSKFMPPVSNPYFAGPPASHPDTFFGRQDTLRFVDETLASPMHNVLVFYGQRRIGKTSILHQIAHRSNQEYQAVFFDLQSSVDSPATDLLYVLAREMAGRLGLPSPNRAEFQAEPDRFRTQLLPQVYERLGSKRLLLLLDEFDSLSAETAPAELSTLPFIQTLNRLIQSEGRRLVFLLVVGRHLKDLPSQRQLQILRLARIHQIGLLEKNEAIQLITQPAQGRLTYQAAAIERIWTLTNGHPYFTQSLCHEIFNQAKRRERWTVTAAQVDAAIEETINASQGALGWFWDEVPPLERFTLYTIGRLTGQERAATLDDLIARRDAQRVQVPDVELRAVPDKLVDRQVLKRDAAEQYSFAVELVRRWIVRSHSLEEVTGELTRAAVGNLAKALFETGRAAYRAGDAKLAVDNFSRALTTDPNYVEARLWLARAYLLMGDLILAINEFVNVERFGGPEQREARLGLADARARYGQQLAAEGKQDEARQEYVRVLELDPKHTLANANLSELLRQQADAALDTGGVSAAQPFYEQALRCNPKAPDLERRIKERLEQYSQAQGAAHKWPEAEAASQLAATLLSKAGDGQELLVRFHLRHAHSLLTQHDFEAAFKTYRRTLEKSGDHRVRQVIENDLLRYGQQQEEMGDWKQAEATLALLVELFPVDLKHRDRLKDSLVRQAEFYLQCRDFAAAGAAYQRALVDDPSNQTLRTLIKAGFQAFRQAHLKDQSLESLQAVEAAMGVLVEILGQIDPEVYQWRSEAREALGDALLQAGQIGEAQQVYNQAAEDMGQVWQLALEPEQIYHRQETDLRLKLAQIDLTEARYDQAEERFRRALTETDADEAVIQRIKTGLDEYRRRQMERHQWHQARQAADMLAQLLPEEVQARLWQAEINVALAGWHLGRAIPDLNEAQRLARAALEQSAGAIAAQVKETFLLHSRQKEQAQPPDWAHAEQIMNRLASLLPDDPAAHRGLAATRLRQGAWYLVQIASSAETARLHLTHAAEVYRRALRDTPDDPDLAAQVKENFSAYQARQPRFAKQAAQTLAGLFSAGPATVEPVITGHGAARKAWPGGAGWFWLGASTMSAVICAGIVYLGLGLPGAANILNAVRSAQVTAVPTGPAATSSPAPAATITTEGSELILPTPTHPPAATSTEITATAGSPPPVTATPAPAVSPTATLTPTLTAYAPPRPAEPEDGAIFVGLDSPPRLAWSGVDELGPDEYYLVRLQYTAGGEPTLYTWRLKETAWELPAALFEQADPANREFLWQVVIAHIPPGGDNQAATELSSPGEPRTVVWAERTPLPQGSGLAVALNPRNEQDSWAVLRGDGIYRSLNGGIAWARVRQESNLETLHIAPANPDVIYAGAYARILRSEDGGTQWEASSIPASAQIFDITTDPDNAGLVFAATERGLLRSEDGGQTWTGLDRAGANGNLVLDGVFHQISAVKTPQGDRVYAAGDGDQIYWRDTADSGGPWQILICTVCARAIYALAINGDRLIAGTDEGRLAVSPNGGDWSRATVPSTVAKLKFSALAIDPGDPQVVYAGSGTHRNPSDGDGLFRSQDGGQTWQRFNTWSATDGQGTYVQSIALGPSNGRVIVIAGSEGVFRSEDGGINWTKQ